MFCRGGVKTKNAQQKSIRCALLCPELLLGHTEDCDDVVECATLWSVRVKLPITENLTRHAQPAGEFSVVFAVMAKLI